MQIPALDVQHRAHWYTPQITTTRSAAATMLSIKRVTNLQHCILRRRRSSVAFVDWMSYWMYRQDVNHDCLLAGLPAYATTARPSRYSLLSCTTPGLRPYAGLRTTKCLCPGFA